MVSERSIPKYIILSLITCGIFSIYWFISLAEDIARLRESAEPKGVTDFIISLLTCGIYSYVCFYRYSKFIAEIQEKRGAKVNDISVIVLIMALFVGIVSLALLQNEINKLVQAS
ncbi:DUF4234 domain-containing protein [Chloroflexota bacterium]